MLLKLKVKMKKKINFKNVLLLVFLLASMIFGCKCNDKKNKDDENPKPDFNRTELLTNIADNIVMPAYDSLNSCITLYETALNNFKAVSDSANLETLRGKFKDLYNAWQYCSVFEVGPAEQELFRLSVNTFPADTVQIKSNIIAGVYDFSSAANVDAKGFPAIDYLLYAYASISPVIVSLTSDAYAAARKKYLDDCFLEIKTKFITVKNTWQSSYRSTFINAAGTDIGSSLGILVNQICYEMDFIKNAKFGIPLGKKTLGTPLPASCEAYYSGISVQLAVSALKNLENVYLGRSLNGADGIGLDDYLDHLEAQYNGITLNSAIKGQFSTTINSVAGLASPLSYSILNNPSSVDAAYLEIQKLLVLLKTDMTSALGVQITYQDNDGD